MNIVFRDKGTIDYLNCLKAMKRFTDERTSDTPDEIWWVSHPPVYTQGQAGKAEHVLKQTDIPIIQSDRGGQITYHGPGQLVVYVLLNLRRHQLTIRKLVCLLEKSTIGLLNQYHIKANADPNAPGIYVNGAKIASLGLRIRHGCSYHGLALNVDMDLSPFDNINPCGYQKQPMTQLKSLIDNTPIDMEAIKAKLKCELLDRLGYNMTDCKDLQVSGA